MKLALSLTCFPVVLTGLSHAATLMPLPTVKIDTVASTGPATPLRPVPISTGDLRGSISAPPSNARVQGHIENSSAGRQPAAAEEGPSSGRQSATRETAAHRATIAPSSRKGRAAAPTTAPSAKDAIAPEIVYNDPGAFHFTAEAGYSSKHLWRGIDLAQFTSSNYAIASTPKADSGVSVIGGNITYNGFLLGLKFIESLDDTFNPFYAQTSTTLDSYSEFVISLNYTRMLVGPDLLQATAGFDFYYYPNGEFWGVDHQGMIYTRIASPHYKWAQPFLEVFYNIATDTNGNGLAAYSDSSANLRGASGSQLVEGGGCEIGVNGGDRIYSNGSLSLALTYSLSTFYKTGYWFEPDGFSHVNLTIGTPLTIGENITITPSVSYVESLQDIAPNIQNNVDFGGHHADSWNSPGFLATIKASYRF